jgi:hypothetical protein
MAVAGRAGASGRLTQLIALVLSLLDQHLHMLLVEAFLSFELGADGPIRVAKLRHAVALLRLESFAPGLF